MSSIKISALTEKSTMAGTEEVLINDSGTSKKFSTQRFLDVKTGAETAKTGAETAETNAEDWASKTTGTVDGTNYSAKYWATQADVGTVAGISANTTTVAGISANVTTVAGVSTNVTAVAGSTADMGTCATNIANINLVASNINTGVIDGIYNYGSVTDSVSSSTDYGSL